MRGLRNSRISWQRNTPQNVHIKHHIHEDRIRRKRRFGKKTTLAALFARALSSQGYPVLAIDADINQHLGQSLGLTQDEAAMIPSMGQEISKIKDYLRGKNPRISSTAEMIKTTPPGHGSTLMTVTEKNILYEYFRKDARGLGLMAVGPFTEDDLGIKCYHSKTGSVELLLNHLIDKEQEYVIVDMTAGGLIPSLRDSLLVLI